MCGCVEKNAPPSEGKVHAEVSQCVPQPRASIHDQRRMQRCRDHVAGLDHRRRSAACRDEHKMQRIAVCQAAQEGNGQDRKGKIRRDSQVRHVVCRQTVLEECDREDEERPGDVGACDQATAQRHAMSVT